MPLDSVKPTMKFNIFLWKDVNVKVKHYDVKMTKLIKTNVVLGQKLKKSLVMLQFQKNYNINPLFVSNEKGRREIGV